MIYTIKVYNYKLRLNDHVIITLMMTPCNSFKVLIENFNTDYVKYNFCNHMQRTNYLLKMDKNVFVSNSIRLKPT